MVLTAMKLMTEEAVETVVLRLERRIWIKTFSVRFVCRLLKMLSSRRVVIVFAICVSSRTSGTRVIVPVVANISPIISFTLTSYSIRFLFSISFSNFAYNLCLVSQFYGFMVLWVDDSEDCGILAF